MQRADETLALAVVPERLARGLHAARDRRVRDDPAVPDLLDDFVARDEALPVLDEQREQGEHLRLERLHRPAQAQFDLGEVELELGEPVNHGRRA